MADNVENLILDLKEWAQRADLTRTDGCMAQVLSEAAGLRGTGVGQWRFDCARDGQRVGFPAGETGRLEMGKKPVAISISGHSYDCCAGGGNDHRADIFVGVQGFPLTLPLAMIENG